MNWPAVFADVRRFVGEMLDAHHAVVPGSDDEDGLVDHCAWCRFNVDPTGAEIVHQPDDIGAAVKMLAQLTAAPNYPPSAFDGPR